MKDPIGRLWQAFLEKIENQWKEKFDNYGTYHNINQKTNFCRAVEEDFYKTLKIDRTKRGIIPKWNTFNHYFNSNGIPGNPKIKTLNIFSQYVGFNDFDDFKNNFSTEITVESNTIQEPLITQTEKNHVEDNVVLRQEKKVLIAESIKNKVVIALAIATLAIIGTSLFWNFKEKDSLEKEQLAVYLTIEAAIDLEFSLYKNYPNMEDTSKLNEYFTKSGQAKFQIISQIKKDSIPQKKLDNNKSFANINFPSVQITIDGDNAKAKTIEKWELIWLNENKEILTEYKVVNKQIYSLVKKDNKWKIDENIYNGKAKQYELEEGKNN